MDHQPTDQYLLFEHLSDIKPQNTAIMYRRDLFGDTQKKNCTHVTRSSDRSFFATVNVYGFRKKHIFVTAPRGDLDIPVSCDNSTEDFRGGISEHTLLSSNVSSESARSVMFLFVLHRRHFFSKIVQGAI